MIHDAYPTKSIPVNCWNPYEQSKTLTQLKLNPSFLEIRPASELDYKQILLESFQKIPEALQLRKDHKYHKKIFPCCQYIKHQAFFKDPLFQNPDTVVISGIKYGDGQQRRLWLQSLKTGKTTTKGTKILNAPTFFHIHKEGQTYCYPFRDYHKRDLPEAIINHLKIKYPMLDHSGCKICPVLVVFQDRIKDLRTKASIGYWNKLSHIKQKQISDYYTKKSR